MRCSISIIRILVFNDAVMFAPLEPHRNERILCWNVNYLHAINTRNNYESRRQQNTKNNKKKQGKKGEWSEIETVNVFRKPYCWTNRCLTSIRVKKQ